jgi:hypothetical protein
MSDVFLGRFLLVNEPDDSVTVYDQNMSDRERERREEDCEDPWVHSAPSMEAAEMWCDEHDSFDYDEDEDLEPEAPAERVAQKKPCGECPFRKKAAPGWLGASHPEGFVGTMVTESEPLPCHSTVNYERPDWHERWVRGVDPRNKLCAGALTLMANQGKRPRTGPTVERDTETVFPSYRAFIEHHRAATVQSWQDPAPGSLDRVGIDGVRKLVRLPVLKDGTQR